MCLLRKTLISTALTNICSLSARIKQKRMEYEAREKAVRDYNQGLPEAMREAGKIEGREETTICIAKNLLFFWFFCRYDRKNYGTFCRNKSKHLKNNESLWKEEFDVLAREKYLILEVPTASAGEVISQDKQKRMEYEAREKAVRDYNQGILEVEQRGEARINKLNSLLIKDKRYNDLERSTNDSSF